MRKRFDRRVVPEPAIAFVRECQRSVHCHLGGGSALSGGWMAHRLSRDIDLFVHDKRDHRELVSLLGDVGKGLGIKVALQRDAGTFARAEIDFGDGSMEVDVVYESLPDLDPPEDVEGVLVESPRDLRAAKLTCILSRTEPRDLVDLLFLDRAGFDPVDDLPSAEQKDAGVDPGVLAWLLSQFPVTPLPQMLEPLTSEELGAFRDELAARMKRAARP